MDYKIDEGRTEVDVEASSEDVNAKTRFIESGDRRIAYRSIGKGLPIILVNRFRGNLDTWDPGFLDALSSKFNIIIIDYSGMIVNWSMCSRHFINGNRCQECC